MSMLAVEGLKLSLGQTPVLADVSLRLEKAEFISILGPSGAGKSTIFRLLTGILSADEGSILFDGEALTVNRQVFAYMPQSDALMPWRRLVDNVTLGLEIRGLSRKAARSIVRPLFAEFGLAGFEQHYPSQLSGGMRQRAALLRTVVQDRPIQLLDEPFGALDALTRMQMQRWLETRRRSKPWTTVLITHDVREAVALSDRIYVLSGRPARTICEITVTEPRPRLSHAPSGCLRAIEADLIEILTRETGELQ